jgi:hypothetical protein
MTTRSRLLTGLTLSAFLGLGASSALAGGWATTTLDPLDGPPRAGDRILVGYTIRQHGVTPVRLERTGIEIRRGARRAFFPGRPSGQTGHYVASVTFPARGAWTWSARQDWFAPYELGTVGVRPLASK